MSENQITEQEISELRETLDALCGVQLDILSVPASSLRGFEPSQIGSIVGALLDACIPQLAELLPEEEGLGKLGLLKHEGILGDREGYPDFKHENGKRLELKLLYVDPVGVEMKKPPTPREPSARLTQKVTLKNVEPENDVLMVVAYQLQPNRNDEARYSPTIIDLGLFSMIECIRARDHRLAQDGGRWFGDFETPAVTSRIGKAKRERGEELNTATYGRKESEGHDFNEDTNFGKLKRVPYEPLQRFLAKHGASYARSGSYPEAWIIRDAISGVADTSAAVGVHVAGESGAEAVEEAVAGVEAFTHEAPDNSPSWADE